MGIGQFTGTRSKYQYTNDQGETYNLKLDDTLATLTGTGLTAAVAGEGIPKPTGFQPRGVYWKGTATGFTTARKFIICGTVDAELYGSDSPQAVTIDGVAGITTGRRGESLSF